MSDQLTLFGAGTDSAPFEPAPALGELSAPEGVYLGTSSWTFEGWQGLVYNQTYASKQAFVRDSLREYAQQPIFGTVGIDSSYYNPLTQKQLSHYAQQLPDGFRCIAKVWDHITLPVFPDHPRYGKRRGQKNPHFLDAGLFIEAVYEPNMAVFSDHLGAFVFEFSPMHPSVCPKARDFYQAIDAFLSALPKGPNYAFELRNRSLFTPGYLKVLRKHKAIHVLNLWSYMPTPGEQMSLADVFTGPAVVSRYMIAPRHRYEDRVKQWKPFKRLQIVESVYRQEALNLIHEAMARCLPLYLVINNKFEGCSPLSVKALVESLNRG